MADGEACLTSVERNVAAKYNSLPHVHPEQLMIRSKNEPVVLFDVRDLTEYRVAHIAGSHHIDPGIKLEEFHARFAETIRGKHVLFYCSVGHRSWALASRLAGALIAREAASVANLRGGIFAWHNRGHGLVDTHGTTPFVHPYNRRWSKYLDFENLARMSPRSKPPK